MARERVRGRDKMDGALLSSRHFFRGARASEVGATRAAVERGENARSDGDGFNGFITTQ